MRDVGAEGIQDPRAALMGPALVDHDLPARSEDERDDPLRIAKPARAQALESLENDPLRQIVGRLLVAKVLQPVQANPRRKSPDQRILGRGVDPRRSFRDAASERCVVRSWIEKRFEHGDNIAAAFHAREV